MLFFRLNQVSRECPFLFVYSIRLRNTLSSMMRAMSVVDEAQTPDLLHGYALHPRTGTRKASPEIRGVMKTEGSRLHSSLYVENNGFASSFLTVCQE